jgi:hypothetical protein
MSSYFLTSAEAKAINDAPQGLIKAILVLAASGLGPEAIHNYAAAIDDGQVPPPLPTPGTPRTLTIQLHSFVKDPRQYSDVYGISEQEAGELRSLAIRDPDVARERVSTLVRTHPRVIQSGRPVVVTTLGAPGDAPSTAQPLANAGAVNRALGQEIALNPGLYGAYKFVVYETKLSAAQRYCVELGSNFVVLSQSKVSAERFARLVSVRGRHHDSVAAHVYYVTGGGQLLSQESISADKWDCVRGPRDSTIANTRRPGDNTRPRADSDGLSVAGLSVQGQRSASLSDKEGDKKKK